MTTTLTAHPAGAAPAPPDGHGLTALLRETHDERVARAEIVVAVAATGLTLAEAGAASTTGEDARRALAARLRTSPVTVREAINTERALRRLHGVHHEGLVECLEEMPRERYSACDLFGLLDGSRVPARPVAAALRASGRPKWNPEDDLARSTVLTSPANGGPATVDSALARSLLSAGGIPADGVAGVAESSRPGRALWCAPATAQVDVPVGREAYPTLVVAESAQVRSRRLRIVGTALAAGMKLDGPQGYRDNRKAIALAARRARSSQKAVRRAVQFEAGLRLLEEQADPQDRALLAQHKPAEMTVREIGQLVRRTHMPAQALIDLCAEQIAAGNTDWSTLADRLGLCGGTHLQRLIGERKQSSYTKNGRRYEGRARRVVRLDLAGRVVRTLGIPPVEFPGL